MKPPARTIIAPNGIKFFAASIIPISPKLPINFQDGWPTFSDESPPMKTNVNKM